MGETLHHNFESSGEVTVPIIDLRGHAETQTILHEDDEFMQGAERDEFVAQVFNKVLLVGIAARDAHPGTIILRNDRQLHDGRWLQQESIEILQSAAMAGLDRLRGNNFMDTVDHAVYERLFERTEDETHTDFIGRLAWVAQQKWHLLTDKDYEMPLADREKFKEIETRLAIASNVLFKEMFYGMAVNKVTQTEAAIQLDNLLEPSIAAEFLDPEYWHTALRYTERRKRTLHRDYLYYMWLIEQGSLMGRVLKSGQIALQATVDA